MRIGGKVPHLSEAAGLVAQTLPRQFYDGIGEACLDGLDCSPAKTEPDHKAKSEGESDLPILDSVMGNFDITSAPSKISTGASTNGNVRSSR